MTINLQKPDITELKPRITVFGVGGGGGNAVNNMITSGLDGVEFVVANTDAQALSMSRAERVVQMGVAVTEGLGAGSQPEVGRAAAEECIDEINDHLNGTHMAFVTAGMGGGTGTGAAPVVARAAREMGILTVGVVTKPFSFEGQRRMRTAESGIDELQKNVDTLIVIPNQNLFRVANDKTTFADAFGMADQVLYSGVACITDLMVKEGLINLDFADVRSVMREMGKAMMGTGESSGEGRAMQAAEAAIANPLLDETSMSGAKGLLISITGGRDMTLFEVDEAATRIREEVDQDANIILGATFDESLEGIIRVSVVATGIDRVAGEAAAPVAQRTIEAGDRLRQAAQQRKVTTPAEEQGAAQPTAAQVSAAAIEAELAIPKPAATPTPVAASGDPAVKIAPFTPQQPQYADPIADDEFQAALEEQITPAEAPHMPAAAKIEDAPRMPRVEDFPPMVRNEISQKASEAKAPESGEERGPMGLLKRLATGLGQQERQSVSVPVASQSAPMAPTSQSAPSAPVAPAAPIHQVAQEAPAASAPQRVVRQDDNPYAPPKSGNMDAHGRAVPQNRHMSDEEQLDIPAFLRRQAN
ncbi:MAG: cell division protein FtsZ [Pseudomonadota bacterium]